MTTTNTTSVPVTIAGRQYRAVNEGLAQILAPYREKPNTSQDPNNKQKRAHNNDEGDQAVFYNPIQQFNRDLSVLVIRTYGEGAVAEKVEKWEKKAKTGHSRKSKSKKLEANNKKRKAAEIDDAAELDPIKRTKSDDDENDDGDLDILPLDNGTNITTVGDIRAAAVNGAANVEPSMEKKAPFTILDALSASGLRAIRYAKEIPFATNIIANDLSAEAVKSIELNIDHNEVKGKVHSNVGDARAYMYSKVGNESQHAPDTYVHRFDVIDLDPYGTAAPFLDASLQALVDGGLLCVTCTDAGVWASNGYPEKAFALYGGITMKGSHSHEAGLRLILNAVATSAAKYGIAIEPLLSLSIDFYARLFIRIHKKPHEVKLLAGTTMFTYNCDFGCGAWKTQLVGRNQAKVDRVGNNIFKHSFAQAPNVSQFCEHCGSKMHLGGPMWAGPLHNPYFVQRVLDQLPGLKHSVYGTVERMRGMLTLALEEDLTLAKSNTSSDINSEKKDDETSTKPDARIIPRLPPETIDEAPFFFLPSNLSKVLHCVTPSEDPLRGAIKRLGYKVTRSHCKAGSFKTNAPWTVIWEILREWVRQESPVKDGKIAPGMPGWRILRKMRSTDTKQVDDLLQEVQRAIEKGVSDKDDAKRLLESALYRLENGLGSQAPELIDTTSDARSRSPGPGLGKQAVEPSKLEVVFDAQLGKEKARGKLVRYQINPRANWGPMNRAGGGATS